MPFSDESKSVTSWGTVPFDNNIRLGHTLPSNSTSSPKSEKESENSSTIIVNGAGNYKNLYRNDAGKGFETPTTVPVIASTYPKGTKRECPDKPIKTSKIAKTYSQTVTNHSIDKSGILHDRLLYQMHPETQYLQQYIPLPTEPIVLKIPCTIPSTFMASYPKPLTMKTGAYTHILRNEQMNHQRADIEAITKLCFSQNQRPIKLQTHTSTTLPCKIIQQEDSA